MTHIMKYVMIKSIYLLAQMALQMMHLTQLTLNVRGPS